MGTRTVIKTNKFEARANSEHQIVSLIFEDKEGNVVDAWLGPGAVLPVLGKIHQLLADHPEIETWESPPKFGPH